MPHIAHAASARPLRDDNNMLNTMGKMPVPFTAEKPYRPVQDDLPSTNRNTPHLPQPHRTPRDKIQEDRMNFVKRIAPIAVVCTAFAFAPAANAAGLSDCVQMAKQVTQALNEAQPGQAKDDASTNYSAGRTLCLSSMYDKGVARYAQALRLLGKS
jgi:hypothetical protein